MRQLPTTEEQEWLLKEPAELVLLGGYARLVLAPIVEPTMEFFSEVSGSGNYVLDRSTRCLLHYAGLHDLEPVLRTFTEQDLPDELVPRTPCSGVAACFLGIEEKRCHFGLDANQSRETEHLIGLMSHEVAHAFRAHHALVREGPEEELLTDLTSVYLGFGILACNNSYRYRQEGGIHWTAWHFTRTSYLPPQAFTFLLAVQLVVRGIDAAGQGRFGKLLEANQREFFTNALAFLEPQNAHLCNLLGIPEKGSWPPQPERAGILQPLPAFVPWEVEFVRVNAGHPVFRVRTSKALLYGMTFGALTLIPVIAAAATLGVWSLLILCVAGTAAGTYAGSRRVRDTCSDPDCRATLPPDAAECPDCGGTISGRIRDRNDRLDAEERFAAERARHHS